MFNNCLIWAHVEYWKRKSKWTAEGRSPQHTPIIYSRPSDLVPYWLDHWVVAYINRDTNVLSEIKSFKPDDDSDLNWWMLWKVLLFKGSVVNDDRKTL